MARQIKLDTREMIEIDDSEGNVTSRLRWNPAYMDIVKLFEKTVHLFTTL